MKFLIGTNNNGKVEGLKLALSAYFKEFEVIGVNVESEVGIQPVNADTYLGSCNRVKNLKKYAKENNIKADYYTAIESGIIELFGKWLIVQIAVIEDNKGLHAYGTCSGLPVPNHLAKEIISSNLTVVMDKVLSNDSEKVNKYGKGGTGILTKGVITRVDLTCQAFIMALTQVNNENWRDKT